MSRRLIAASLLAASLTSCVEREERGADDHSACVHTVAQAIRPTQGAGHLGNGYGEAPVASYPSPGGKIRVWWAEQGPDAPPLADLDDDGVPDFVQEVATVADEVVANLVRGGWRLPISDIDRNDGDFGGDERYDIYLKDLTAGDGYVVAEGCQGRTCSGYMVIENDFRGHGYSSLSEAIRVLVSHEFFHMVQNAYSAGMPPWLSEGSATWHEEHFYPPQSDFERLTRHYLADPQRSLTDRWRGPQDGFAYGAGLFFWSLELAHDHTAIRDAFELMASGQDPLAALDAALVERGESLAAAFRRFAVWNFFTSSRAVEGQGYPQAASLLFMRAQEFGARTALNWDVDPDPLATHYASVTTDAPVTISAAALTDANPAASVAVIHAATFARDGSWTHVAPGATEVITQTGLIHLAIIHDAPSGRRPTRVQVRLHRPAVEPEPDPDPEPEPTPEPEPEPTPQPQLPEQPTEDEGCSTTPRAPAPAPLATSLLALAALATRRRRC